ncbi:chorismate-binding protein [Croceimicrobium hydrocarbonivorans]|uniref:Chorismate-binding protein n=1 Tax=Croceimicrobium hydrocarbonivorans TaxID=2761580 RepID=A0A7H0VDG1_9FLAO|nr:chorismate-binding protein [Croceimicrobium hydrocarbonivorans]QNR23759.1 chorismate-binding protein [Croceimicrobium hydrocarbonivorans]
MGDSKIFLAYRVPGGKLQFYRESQDSPQLFHFVNFKADLELQMAMEACAPYDFQAWHFHSDQEAPSKESQLTLLDQSIQALQNGEGAKVVISRLYPAQTKWSPIQVLERMDALYPQATVYLFSHPEAGTWLGASPENLLSLDEGNLEIASLAGTRKWEERDTFTAKEREEQAIVSRSIIDLLKAQNNIEAIEGGNTEIKKAGNLAHLYNAIQAKAGTSFKPESFVKELHPTPAVGGSPKGWAIDFILKNELYDRRFYTGYFGWSHLERSSAQFWVNLRCAEYNGLHNLNLYVGGGITAQSQAMDEWKETEAKAQTILKALEKQNV